METSIVFDVTEGKTSWRDKHRVLAWSKLQARKMYFAAAF